MMRETDETQISVRINKLDDASLQFHVRLIYSFFDEVYTKEGDALSENLWSFPVASLGPAKELDKSEEALRIFGYHEQEDQRFLMLLLVPIRAFARTEDVPPSGVSARQHAHSSIDELCLILGRSGTMRTNGKERTVVTDDLELSQL